MNKLTIMTLSVLLLSSCSGSTDAGNNLESQLDNAYEALNVARLGLEYPPNQKVLDDCVKNNDASCLRSYKRVQQGKKLLLEAIDRDEALVLRTTLDRIKTKCPSEKTEDSFICTGAVVSLYFFDKQRYQTKIMEALRNNDIDLANSVFFMKFEWMYNRPDPDQWITFIRSLPDDKMPPASKNSAIEDFEKSKHAFEKFGVML